MATEMNLETIYQRRFGPDLQFRERMWQILCRDYFQRFVPPDSSVLEVGAGYCEFINTIVARRKIAVDLNPDVRQHAAAGVEVLVTPSTDLSALAPGSLDIAFASNFFEHLERRDIVQTMREVVRVLRPGGRFSNCSMLEAIALCQEIAGRELRWTYTESNRIGDHIWYVSDTGKFRAHYPDWRQHYDLRGLLEDIYDKNAARWAAPAELAGVR